MTMQLMIRLVVAAGLLGLVAGCNIRKWETRPLGDVNAAGRQAYARGDYASSEQEYRLYINRRPHSAIGHHGLGRALMAQGQYQAAASEFQVAWDIEPLNMEHLDALCEALLASEDFDRLFGVLRRRANGSSDPQDYIRLARFAERAGTTEEAHSALLTWARIDRGMTIEPQLALAEFYRRHGDREREMMRLRAALFINVRHPETNARLRELGEIPGETLAVVPPERD
ncbi:MAG: hypothetical protein KF866_02070 [Phycisphaeraceae bacterium]|nr:hypothetical protein [Phycisphaeraceae bacterium]MCW5753520.1 hypothetical protein [Phycisphaeraceae bacterium]